MTCRPQISLLVPFRESKSAPHRARAWQWLAEYWKHELPDAEVVVGQCTGEVFSKTSAVNAAAREASGRIFVIIDADAYLRGDVLLQCAREIDEAARRGLPLWFVPYRRLYRLTWLVTERVLTSHPHIPHRPHHPPRPEEIEQVSMVQYGHHFGAMCMVMHREAFETIGGMDERFVGWGAEDSSFLRALSTLHAPYKSVDASIWHLWHPATVHGKGRLWDGQGKAWAQMELAQRYAAAVGDRCAMLKIVHEAQVHAHCKPMHARHAEEF